MLLFRRITLKKNNFNSISVKGWLFRIALVGTLLLAGLFVFIYVNLGPRNFNINKAERKVSIRQESGRYSFFKSGKPFLVKGGAGYTNIKELAECGGNTIICWDTAKLESTLRQADQYNVAVIIGIDIPGVDNTEFYNDKKNIENYFNAYKNIVVRFKDHPSLLAWCLGNELIMPFSFTNILFYKSYNRLLSMIHDIDPDHPVSTAVMNIPKRNIINMQWRIPALDFICVNTYNKLKLIEQELNKIKMVWNGPYLVGEWAPNGGWEAALTTWDAPIENTSTKKAEQYYELFNKYMPVNDSRFLGSLAFYWGNRQEYTHTWYSVFNENGIPTEIKEVLKDCWTGKLTHHTAPGVQYMLVDSLGAFDNIIVNCGSQHNASILMEPGQTADSLRYQWEILKEDWYYWGKTWDNFKRPATLSGLIKDSTIQYCSFVAPKMEGPYRVYVTVYNSKGYCATANTPIYVVE